MTQLERRALRVGGVVQGVGFRPFVFALATELGLVGCVGNDGAGVFVEIEGHPERLDEFCRRLVTDAPPLAVLEAVDVRSQPPRGDGAFTIAESTSTGAGAATALVPADVALCADCRRELLDPADRRYRYPFVNCTNCGPRFTIIEALPYDRPATTMAGFAMCASCSAEYHDPRDRRFHAQPVACPQCGPRAWLVGQDVGDPLAEAARLLAGGAIVAVKGVGGFHLAVNAADREAVQRLRAAKHRSAKPFAVMAKDLAAVATFAEPTDAELDLLTGRVRPIVLLAVRPQSPIGEIVAPGNGRVGVMLPYSPLHELLLAAPEAPPVLVMTSGNRADEPIAIDEHEAAERLGELADHFLVHDRPIARPCDDSVVRVTSRGELPVRRSRGYAPYPVKLTFDAPPVLAVGGEIKTTFCLAAGRNAWLSQHIGDMGNVETLEAFDRSVASLQRLYGVAPVAVVSDRHPGYLTARWAAERASAIGVPHLEVQHHHAHVGALMAEHGLGVHDRILAFVFDGTGYGDDGTIWGGEVLLGGYGEVTRVAHLAPTPLPGGDAAIRHPARVALAHLWAAGIPWTPDLPAAAAMSAAEQRLLAQQLERNVACVPTSSMGRLFDAVASLAGVCQHATYEAQPAIELEALHDESVSGSYRFEVVEQPAGGPVLVEPGLLWAQAVADVRAGHGPGVVATRFHRAVVDVMARLAIELTAEQQAGTVGLTGGVFQNVVLLERAAAALERVGLRVLHHRLVPPNDGGLALGQAAVAAVRLGRAQAGTGSIG